MADNSLPMTVRIENLQSELAAAYVKIAELQKELRDAGLMDAVPWDDATAIALADGGWGLRKIAVHFGYSPNSATTVGRRIEEARRKCGMHI